MDISKSQTVNAEQHDLFFKQLDSANNRFSVIADYFGQGVFSKYQQQQQQQQQLELLAAEGSSSHA
jgi:hypothetical protein